MKTKGILTFVFSLCITFAFGQFVVPSGTVGNSNNANVGVGTFPGSIGGNPVTTFHINAFEGEAWLGTTRPTGQGNARFVFLTGDIGTVNGSVGYSSGANAMFIENKLPDGQIIFETDDKERLRVQPGGNVGIGTANPLSTLSVNGKIESEEIQVVQDVADYVFEADYKMLSLEELETYIGENGHLPNIQTQEDVTNNRGLVSLGDLSVSLMAKVEELTLHMIEMNKRIKTLETENKALKAGDE